MTKAALQTALDESLGYCAEYRKVIENRDRSIENQDGTIASQRERIGELEAAVEDRDNQLRRFAEAYKKLKTGLEFYEAQATQAKEQHYRLRKQYETGLEEHKQKLLATFKELSSRYEANAKKEIAKAVASCPRVEGLWDAVQSIGQALKRVPELKEIVREEFREWREAVWERFTGQPLPAGNGRVEWGKGTQRLRFRRHGQKQKHERDRGGWGR